MIMTATIEDFNDCKDYFLNKNPDHVMSMKKEIVDGTDGYVVTWAKYEQG